MGGGRAVCFIGCVHSCDPAHEQFPIISAAFSEFNPQTVLIQGARPFAAQLPKREFERQKAAILAENNDSLIRKAAEILYVARLALEHDMSLYSPEPPLAESVAHVSKVCAAPLEKILLYLVCAELGVLYRKGIGGNRHVSRDVECIVDCLKEDLAGMTSEIRLSSLDSCALKYLNYSSLTEVPAEVIFRLMTPFGNHPLVDVAVNFSHYRDLHLFAEIFRRVEAKERVFVCYGRTHLLKLRPALDAYMRRFSALRAEH